MDYVACSLRNFSCSNYKEPIEVKSNERTIFYLLHKEQVVLNIPMSYNYGLRYGTDEVDRVMSDFICYSQHEPSVTNQNKRDIIVNNRYATAQNFSNALWFIKDNAVTPHFATISSDQPIEPTGLRRNVYYTNSEGGYATPEFTVEEVKAAMSWYPVLEQFLPKLESSKVNLSGELTNMSSYLRFDIPSFERAYYFLDIARKTDFLPGKIASYISVLESLFAVKGENTHKVAERTAAFIGEDENSRYQLFKSVINIYKIRSDYIHGSEIKNSTHELLPQTSKQIDSIVREVLIKMYSKHPELNYRNKKDKKNPNAKSFEGVNEWFNELIFSKG